MTNPLISIFVPTYNRSSLLAECLRSCLEQDFDNYEIVVGDDGSNDDTPQVVEQLKKETDKIVYLRLRENTRAQLVGNLARRMRGRFLLRLGDDDRLYPNVLGRYVKAIEQDKARFAYGDIRLFSDDGTVNRVQAYEDYSERQDRLLADLFQGNVFPCPGSLIDADLYWRHLVRLGYPGFYEGTFHLITSYAGRAIDYLEWILLAGTGHRFKHVGGTTVHYRVHSGQDSNHMFKNGSEESFVTRMMLALHSMREIDPRAEWETAPVAAEARFLLGLAKTLGNVFDAYNAMACYRRVLTLDLKDSPLLDEALRGLTQTVFLATGETSTRINEKDQDLHQLAMQLGLPDTAKMIAAYQKLSATIDNRLSKAQVLRNSGQLEEARQMAKEIVGAPTARTAVAVRFLSELCREAGDVELAYHYAIFAASISGYAEPYYRYAQELCEELNRDNEVEMARRRTLIQPTHLMRGLYPDEITFGTAFELADEINQREGKFYLHGEVETLNEVDLPL